MFGGPIACRRYGMYGGPLVSRRCGIYSEEFPINFELISFQLRVAFISAKSFPASYSRQITSSKKTVKSTK